MKALFSLLVISGILFVPMSYSVINVQAASNDIDEFSSTVTLVVGSETAVTATEKAGEKVPGWIKNNAKWWSDGEIDDNTFLTGIQFMIKEKIINIPNLPPQAAEKVGEKVPGWIKNNAGWWAEGLITEDDFVKGIEFLIENGIIDVS